METTFRESGIRITGKANWLILDDLVSFDASAESTDLKKGAADK